MKNGFGILQILIVILVIVLILLFLPTKLLVGDKSIKERSSMSLFKSNTNIILRYAEDTHALNKIMGNTSNITCEEVSNIDLNDYSLCEISIIEDQVNIKVIGKNKFDGYTCVGTKENMACTDDLTNR